MDKFNTSRLIFKEGSSGQGEGDKEKALRFQGFRDYQLSEREKAAAAPYGETIGEARDQAEAREEYSETGWEKARRAAAKREALARAAKKGKGAQGALRELKEGVEYADARVVDNMAELLYQSYKFGQGLREDFVKNVVKEPLKAPIKRLIHDGLLVPKAAIESTKDSYRAPWRTFCEWMDWAKFQVIYEINGALDASRIKQDYGPLGELLIVAYNQFGGKE